MNILVYDVAASRSGALSVLKDYHRKVCEHPDGNHYFFAVSTPELAETGQVTVLRFPGIKKSWLHRLFFDYFKAPGLVKKYKIDKVFSLTNITLRGVEVPQELYLHQPVPFVPQKFSFWQNKRLWVIKNIISRMIYRSVRAADKVIVQTQWMKEACVRICQVPAEKIVVEAPELDRSLLAKYRESPGARRTFFFPATPFSYKNHRLVIEAAKILAVRGVSDYKVIFTFRGDESPLAIRLRKEAEGLPIEFHGPFPREEVYGLYAQSTLLYPSYIETFGMPLLEARLTGAPILAARTPFAEEILSGYERAGFFAADDVEGLADRWMEYLGQGK